MKQDAALDALGYTVGDRLARRDEPELGGTVTWADGFASYCRVRWDTGEETDERQGTLRKPKTPAGAYG